MAYSKPFGVMPGVGDLSFDESPSPFPFLSIPERTNFQTLLVCCSQPNLHHNTMDQLCSRMLM
ncbi:hypothetical protein L798_11475 [Zootermopsis nevadensis]|uniref:Uncharacterized protein n=1 Tax=Zootermopsis nevadensis TaxID=136037 RepID=A0A067R8F3_ZOONE|nr:hypothetical protein L798_11475 [Zootermopsis nevadensis]